MFDLAAFANEREHIQRIVENHFWLFGEQYTERDVSAVIISNQKTFSGNRPISEEVTINIQNDDKYKWVEEYEQSNLCGNMMTPYVVLYLLLQTEGQLITKYQLCIEKLKDQENKD